MSLEEQKEKLSVKIDEQKVKHEERKEQAKINREERKLKLKAKYTDKKITAHIDKAIKKIYKVNDDAEKDIVKLLDVVDSEIEADEKPIELILYKAENNFAEIFFKAELNMQKAKNELIKNLEKDVGNIEDLINIEEDLEGLKEEIFNLYSAYYSKEFRIFQIKLKVLFNLKPKDFGLSKALCLNNKDFLDSQTNDILPENDFFIAFERQLIESDIDIPNGPYRLTRAHFLSLEHCQTLSQKIDWFTSINKAVFADINAFYSKKVLDNKVEINIGSDEMISILAFVLTKTHVPSLLIDLKLFCPLAEELYKSLSHPSDSNEK